MRALKTLAWRALGHAVTLPIRVFDRAVVVLADVLDRAFPEPDPETGPDPVRKAAAIALLFAVAIVVGPVVIVWQTLTGKRRS